MVVWELRPRAGARQRPDPAPTRMRDLPALPFAGTFVLCDGRFVEINPKFAEIVGYAAGDLIGRALESLAWDGRARRACARIRRAGETRPAVLNLRRRSGARIHVEVSSWRVRRLGRAAVVGAAVDVSERIAADRALRSARDTAATLSPSKSLFLANMSHELRTPLNAIIGFSEVMERGIHGPLGAPQYAGYARDIRESGEHLLNLIDDLLEFSRLEAGDVDIAAVPIDIARLAGDSLRAASEIARKAQVELTLDLDAGLPRLQSDAPRIRHVLRCLLSNAIKFTPAGGHVTLAVRRGDGEVRLEVRDTGIGMDEADIPRACSPFYQTGRARARRQQGCGLGLALTTRLCELLGGRLELETRLRRGTRATVVLPSADASADAASPPASVA